MIHGKKIIAVLPAYNAEKTLRQTVDDIPKEWVDEIILVDDASKDQTAAVSRSLGLRTIVHPRNRGYGGNQKTCYREALASGADIAIMIHPDHQYDPTLVPQMVRPILEDRADAVFGSRMLHAGDARKGGMPEWKFIANKALTFIANSIIGTRLSEYHSGFRAYSRDVLEKLPLEENSDNFVFDTEIIVQLKIHKFRIVEIPIPTKYFKDASTVGFWKGVQYGADILAVLLRYIAHRLKVRTSKQFEL
ncbi:MAG: glycosyltransferase family 2 protein [Patescibacteria group bacterium]|jgi:glycosyltransferase involved in cell wall biosynthesis